MSTGPRVLGVLVLALLLVASASRGGAAQGTPSAAGELRVAERRPIDLDGRRILGLAPDGRRLAAYGATELCVPDARTLAEERCAALPDGAIQWDAAVWSPDGERLAFTENSAITFVDSDLWVLEAKTGRLTNLTDDGFEGGLPLFDDEHPDPIPVDLLPAWTPDGRALAFVRGAVRDGDWRGTTILRLGLDGGEPEEIRQVTRLLPIAVYFGMRWTPDGARLLYSVAKPEQDDPENGVWIVDADGENPRRLAGTTDPERGSPTVLDVANDRALLFYPILAGRFGPTGESLHALIDLDTGDLEPIEVPTSVVGDADAPAIPQLVAFSPDGDRLLYTLGHLDPPGPIVVVDPDGAHRPVVDDLPALLGHWGRGLDWAADGTVYVANGPTAGTLLRLDGEGATRAASATEPPDA